MKKENMSFEIPKCSICKNTDHLVKLKGKDVCKACIQELIKLK